MGRKKRHYTNNQDAGIQCEWCESTLLLVEKTIRDDHMVIRVRKCRRCGLRTITEEVARTERNGDQR